MTLDPPDTSIMSQISCVRRELAMRENVYSSRVSARRMSQREADCEIAAMRAVLMTLLWCRDNRDRIIAFLKGEKDGAKSWLVELKPSAASVPTYYGITDEGVLGWTSDDKQAQRFARNVDAEMVITDLGLTEAFACEHVWLPPPSRATEP